MGDNTEMGRLAVTEELHAKQEAARKEAERAARKAPRILPLKITTEVREIKEKMTIEEAVADLRACGLDEMLAFYLKRYPIGPDEEDSSWADGIDIDNVRDPPIDVTPEKAPDDTAK